MKERRDSYQQGTIQRVKRKRGPDVWVFRYRRYLSDGTSERVAKQIATVEECPSKAKAKEKAEALRRQINEQKTCVYFKDLVADWKAKKLHEERPHYQQTQLSNMKYLEDRWNDERLDEIAKLPANIETWLNALKSRTDPTKDLSKQTRQHVRNLMHKLMTYARSNSLFVSPDNPVSAVRVTKGERKKRRKLLVTPELFRALMNDPELPQHIKTMAQVAMFTGMGISEILGLKWEDIDFANLIIHVKRSVVGDHVDETKTAAREAEVYIGDHIADVLAQWKKDFFCYGDWVFGSARTEMPFHASTLRGDYLSPAGVRAGVEHLGWHTFRHTYRAYVRDVAKAPLELQSQMLRHSNLQMTTEYGRESEAKQKAMRKHHVQVVKKFTGTEG